MIIGRIDEVDGHYIGTRFAAFIIPTECLYVTRDGGRTTLVDSKSDGVRIQTDWRSVMLAYARVWLPVIAIASPLLAWLVTRSFSIPLLASSVVMIALSVVAHRTGRHLPDHEKARLRLLGTVTGLRIDPTKLLPAMRDVKRDSLGELMEKGGIPITHDGILSVLDDIPMPAMALVYGYACYAGDDPDWRACAHQVYLRHEQGDI